MKKYDLFELAILGIGAWATYQFITIGFVVVVYLVQLGLDGFRIENTQQYLISNIILCIGYFLVSHVALRKTDVVVNYLKPGVSKHVEELGEEPQATNQKPAVSKADIMRMIIIGIGILLAVPQVPQFLQELFVAFKSKVNPDEYQYENVYLPLSVLRIFLPVLLILFSKKITALLKI